MAILSSCSEGKGGECEDGGMKWSAVNVASGDRWSAVNVVVIGGVQ